MSITRLGTASMYDRTINNINKQQAELTSQMEHSSAGKRVIRASDDPVAAAQAELTKAKRQYKQTRANSSALNSQVFVSDDGIHSAEAQVQKAQVDLGKAEKELLRRQQLSASGAISKEDAKLKKKQYKAKLAERRYPSVAYEIAAALEEKTNREIRVTVPGHTQRGGAPCAYDRVLATRVGAYAAELILNKEYGYMVGIVDGDTQKVPLSEVAGKLKSVDPECQMIKDAKTIGISFGE